MDWVGLVIQLIGGAAGGYGTGRVAKNVSINPTVDAIVGLVGGFGGTWLAGLIPAHRASRINPITILRCE